MISFKHRQFQKDFILMSIRWYLAYSLSYRDIEELMLARGVRVDHSTINRWVIKYAPELEQEFSAKHKLPGGSSWRADETYIKVKGIWALLFCLLLNFFYLIFFFRKSNKLYLKLQIIPLNNFFQVSL